MITVNITITAIYFYIIVKFDIKILGQILRLYDSHASGNWAPIIGT